MHPGRLIIDILLIIPATYFIIFIHRLFNKYGRFNIYYAVKPFIPRRLQIFIRSLLNRYKRNKYKNIWPINEKSAKLPENWTGWPEQKQFSLVLTHDVEWDAGQKKCIRLAQLEMDLGFRSAFYFVPKRYDVDTDVRNYLRDNGFEIGVHGYYHDGTTYLSRKIFLERAIQINKVISGWDAVGFRSPAMIHNLDWHCDLKIKYDASTFDTDPFEPLSEGVNTIFPFKYVHSQHKDNYKGYIELPYTLPQDFNLFILLKEKNINIWKNKLDWIVKNGGMALHISHPDYMDFGVDSDKTELYPYEYYKEFLLYVKEKYENNYWHALPRDVAAFVTNNFA